jgi:hypothetical protein
LKIDRIGFSETSLTTYQYTLRNIQEERRCYVDVGFVFVFRAIRLTFLSLAVSLRTARFNIQKLYTVLALR